MDYNQSARLDSYKLIVSESKKNPLSIALIPKFGVVINEMSQICTDIDLLHIIQEKDLTGITTDKNIDHDKIIDYTLGMSGAIHSFAEDTNNNTLKSLINYKAGQLESMNQAELIAASGIVLDEIKKIAEADIANEGITAEEITAYSDLIDHYKSIKSSKREAVIDKSGVTEKMDQLFIRARLLVKNKLDKLANQFKTKDPDFYLKYKAARSVKYRSPSKKNDNNNPNPPA